VWGEQKATDERSPDLRAGNADALGQRGLLDAVESWMSEIGGEGDGSAEAPRAGGAGVGGSGVESGSRMRNLGRDPVRRNVDSTEGGIGRSIPEDVDALEGTAEGTAEATHFLCGFCEGLVEAEQAEIGPEFPNTPCDEIGVSFEFGWAQGIRGWEAREIKNLPLANRAPDVLDQRTVRRLVEAVEQVRELVEERSFGGVGDSERDRKRDGGKSPQSLNAISGRDIGGVRDGVGCPREGVGQGNRRTDFRRK